MRIRSKCFDAGSMVCTSTRFQCIGVGEVQPPLSGVLLVFLETIFDNLLEQVGRVVVVPAIRRDLCSSL